MKLLLTNDDGIKGEGLTVLASVLQKAGHEVVVVAPDCNNSAISHKINMRTPLRLVDCSEGKNYSAYSLSGTPADCVMFALSALGIRADAVLSGINDGNNLGSDCLYSGTVSAAQEGAQNGIASIALSTDFQCGSEEFTRAAEIVCKNLEDWVALAAQAQGALNVNIPVRGEIKGIRFCKAAQLTYHPDYDYQRLDGENLYRYRLGSNRPEAEAGENDVQFFRQGYVTITPLLLDKTDYHLLERWKK